MTDQAPPRGSADSIIVDCDLPEPPEKVWRALTEPALLAAWLMPNDIHPEVGRHFVLQTEHNAGGTITCEVLAIEPQRLLRLSWRGEATDRDADGRPLDTIVTFELGRTASGGTHLRIVHSGFAAGVGQPATMMAGAGGALSILQARPVQARSGGSPAAPPPPLPPGRITMQAVMRLAA